MKIYENKTALNRNHKEKDIKEDPGKYRLTW